MTDLEDDLRAAIREVRREQRVADVVVGAVYAAFALVGTSLGLAVLGVGTAPVVGPLRGLDLAAVIAAVAVGTTTVVRRQRAPPVERFEDANPRVAEAFRTARDAVAADRDGPVVRRLYGDVLDRLAETSSRDLLPVRRLAAVVAAVAVIGTVTLGVQVAGVSVLGAVDFGGGDGPTDPAPPGVGNGSTPERVLKPPGGVLDGARDNFTLGNETVQAIIDAHLEGAGKGKSGGGEASFPDGQTPIQPASAGYDHPDPVAEAELIREYTLAVQGNQTHE
ncbi:MAG: hypothetical protein ABEJ42_00310 [Halobacteriaceae archaeon]